MINYRWPYYTHIKCFKEFEYHYSRTKIIVVFSVPCKDCLYDFKTKFKTATASISRLWLPEFNGFCKEKRKRNQLAI